MDRANKRGIFLVVFLVFGFGCSISAQEIWSLEKCISHAIDKSLQVEGSLLTVDNTEIDITTARQSRYPSLSASSNLGWNFGRTIDPTNNQFITQTFVNNGFGLNSNVVLFNAGKINNSIEQSVLNTKASLKDLEQTKRDIALNVSTLYLNILFAKENLTNAENQLKLTKEQLTQLNKQIAVGNRPENDVLDLDAQIATNEQSIVEAKNSYTINLLNLKQLLRLDPDYNMDVFTPVNLPFGTDPEITTFNELYNMALSNQAGVKANELRVKIAELGEKIAKADLYPSIVAFGSARSNYSNQGVKIDGFTDVISDQTILINGVEQTISFKQQSPNFVKNPYTNQLSENLSYGFGLSANIPIFNNNLTRSSVQKAKLNINRANLNYIQSKETLKITVGQAISDARASKSRYQSSLKTLTAQTNLYNNAVKRFEIGNLNAFELTRLKTQMETTSVNLLIAKYDYFFRTKVLDFYLGKPITF